jgi:hypothetical protein
VGKSQLHIVLEDIDILFSNEISTIEFPWVFLKMVMHCHAPERLAAVHATFDRGHQVGFPFKLIPKVSK